MDADLMPLDYFLGQLGGIPIGAFERCAHYYEAMDAVVYLQEDVSYRADRVDAYLTLLWHPHEDRAVGVKLKGWRHLFGQLQKVLESSGATLPDDRFIPLISAMELALTAGTADQMIADVERERIAAKYEQAKEIVSGVKFDPRELALAV